MPYRANEPRRHKIPRARYKVRNWPEYDRALQQRGSLTVWVTPEALAAWHPPRTGRRGRPRDYSDVAIETRAPAAPGLWSAVAADQRSATSPRPTTGPQPGQLAFAHQNPSHADLPWPRDDQGSVTVLLCQTGTF